MEKIDIPAGYFFGAHAGVLNQKPLENLSFPPSPGWVGTILRRIRFIAVIKRDLMAGIRKRRASRRILFLLLLLLFLLLIYVRFRTNLIKGLAEGIAHAY